MEIQLISTFNQETNIDIALDVVASGKCRVWESARNRIIKCLI